jgi:hypothetical protein
MKLPKPGEGIANRSPGIHISLIAQIYLCNNQERDEECHQRMPLRRKYDMNTILSQVVYPEHQ